MLFAFSFLSECGTKPMSDCVEYSLPIALNLQDLQEKRSFRVLEVFEVQKARVLDSLLSADSANLCRRMDRSEQTAPDEDSSPQYTLVSTSECFQNMLERLIPAPRLAIDIEADSLYHYFEKVCLIQISSDIDTYIVDPLAIGTIGNLAPLMSNPDMEKVFHAAGYDIFCLRRDYGFAFANIFDTHAAAQLLGYKLLGLGALMEKLLGIHHSKRRQRDDWSRRPLEPRQLEYAAMDTHHLLRLRDTLENELRQKSRLSWAKEEFETEAAVERSGKEFDTEGYRRIKGNRDLPVQDQLALRALYLLRDQAARKLDVPPFKVLTNTILMDLAKKPPKSVREMFNRPGISRRVARKFGAAILNTIEDSRRHDPSILEISVHNNYRTPNHTAKLRLEKLRLWRKQKANELGLHVGVVFPANLLENLAAAPPADKEQLANIPGIRRWRVREFGEEILQLLRSQEDQIESSGRISHQV
jgi:ribonuclease D